MFVETKEREYPDAMIGRVVSRTEKESHDLSWQQHASKATKKVTLASDKNEAECLGNLREPPNNRHNNTQCKGGSTHSKLAGPRNVLIIRTIGRIRV